MSSIEPLVSLPSEREKGTERRRAFGFGLVVALACSVLGGWSLHREHTTRGHALIGFGVLLLFYSIVHPPGAIVLRRRWLQFGAFLGRINAVILLSIAYVLVLTPLSLLVRASSKRSFKKERGRSYFTDRGPPRDPKHFEHPY
jgi:hypothetical protein